MADEWMDVFGSGELLKKTVRASGRPAEERLDIGRRVTVHYVGRVEGTDVVFEDTRKNDGKPVQLTIGDGDVVAGLDLGVALLQVGEVALLKIGPKYGFGSIGLKPDVPADATIVYEVEVLDATEAPAVADMTAQERLAAADRKRDRGNWHYTRDEWDLAMNIYNKALKFLEDFPKGDQAAESSAVELRVKVLSNTAQSQIRMELFKQAKETCARCLTLDPKNVKTLYRAAYAHHRLSEHDEAIELLRTLLKHDPQNRDAAKLMQEVKAKKQADVERERQLYSNMMKSADFNGMEGVFAKELPQTPFGRMLSTVSPFLGRHYRSPDLYAGLALLACAIALFVSLLQDQ